MIKKSVRYYIDLAMKNSGGHHKSSSNGEKGTTARGRRRSGGKTEEEAAVEELLQSAQDEMMLKLSLDSHVSKTPKDSLPSDLRRRFDALKTVPISSSNSNSNSNSICSFSSASSGVPELSQRDLMARFNALKGKTTAAGAAPVDFPSPDGIVDDDEEEDEVDKIMRWAMDAARLDPSPPSDSDNSDLSD